jgi:hypothetical protein
MPEISVFRGYLWKRVYSDAAFMMKGSNVYASGTGMTNGDQTLQGTLFRLREVVPDPTLPLYLKLLC